MFKPVNEAFEARSRAFHNLAPSFRAGLGERATPSLQPLAYQRFPKETVDMPGVGVGFVGASLPRPKGRG